MDGTRRNRERRRALRPVLEPLEDRFLLSASSCDLAPVLSLLTAPPNLPAVVYPGSGAPPTVSAGPANAGGAAVAQVAPAARQPTPATHRKADAQTGDSSPPAQVAATYAGSAGVQEEMHETVYDLRAELRERNLNREEETATVNTLISARYHSSVSAPHAEPEPEDSPALHHHPLRPPEQALNQPGLPPAPVPGHTADGAQAEPEGMPVLALQVPGVVRAEEPAPTPADPEPAGPALVPPPPPLQVADGPDALPLDLARLRDSVLTFLRQLNPAEMPGADVRQAVPVICWLAMMAAVALDLARRRAAQELADRALADLFAAGAFPPGEEP